MRAEEAKSAAKGSVCCRSKRGTERAAEGRHDRALTGPPYRVPEPAGTASERASASAGKEHERARAASARQRCSNTRPSRAAARRRSRCASLANRTCRLVGTCADSSRAESRQPPEPRLEADPAADSLASRIVQLLVARRVARRARDAGVPAVAVLSDDRSFPLLDATGRRSCRLSLVAPRRARAAPSTAPTARAARPRLGTICLGLRHGSHKAFSAACQSAYSPNLAIALTRPSPLRSSTVMSERGQFRGGRGGGRGDRGGRGGGRGGHGGQGGQADRPKKENILDLAKYMDKEITVKFNGGREVSGKLKGYDQLMNLVLDEVSEKLRDDEGNESCRSLGLLVARGTLIVLIAPVDGSEQIENPFNVTE